MPHTLDATRPRIRLRFTLLYASTLLVVLLGAATALRFALRATLQQEFDESVRSSAALVTQFFRTEIAEYRTIDATLTHIASELVFEDRAIHIRRPDNSHFGDSITPRFSRENDAGPIRAVRFPLERELAPGWEVEVHAGMANLNALRARIDRWFLIGIPLLVLLAAGAGWWLTGRTLKPVGDMAAAAARIGPATGERLPILNAEDELGRLGLRFNALLDRLDGALSQQRQFLADAAHELRTPVARMRARVELALSPAAPTDANVLATLEAELRLMSQQVDELLELARDDAAGESVGKAAGARHTPVFLDDLVADAISHWTPQARQRGTQLVVARLEEARIMGDAAQLARLLGLLLDNAIRYGREAGVVHVGVTADGDTARLDVEDDGVGIPEAERTRVFDRFYRGDAARQRRPDGSGLGLAIAAAIVRRHGGTIAVDTGTLGGARFTVRLPIVALT